MKLKLFRRIMVECTCEYGASESHTHSEPTGKMKTVEVSGRRVQVPETKQVPHVVGRPMIGMQQLDSSDDGSEISYGGTCKRCGELIECTVRMAEAGMRKRPEGWDDDHEPAAAVVSSAD
ncbi:MAG TPA: hypothetical protein VFH61_11115 [Thermoleophilia bacterium]|nr:hypothetical protein [Thermoleophilia bacterium]